MRKIKSKYILLAGIFILSLIITASNDEYKFKVNKSFEIFGHLFKELSMNYVLDINPESLMEEGIAGMLKSLDPYTTYYNEKETGELDVLTDGNYVGFGITVGEHKNHLMVIDVRHNFGAHKAGMMIGDILIEIDSVNISGRKSKDIKKYTKGKPDSKAIVKVIRPGLNDTLTMNVTRERVIINNVDFSGYIQEGIGYIKLSRFSRNSTNELRTELLELKRKGNLRSLILDLRSNPGGLLDAAIDICGLFFDKGTMVVTTKGRTSAFTREYRTHQDPIFPQLPIAVLIDGGSASASEIVAGAFQDYDRGIVLGKKSFGKGLVQSVYNLPYRSKVKLTTAKYYTPSGRCIQKVDIAEKVMAKTNKKLSDSIFYTKNGRQVFENNGISPDSSIEENKYSSIVSELLDDYLIFDFVSNYVGKGNYDLNDYFFGDEIYRDFKTFIEEKKYFTRSGMVKEIKKFEEIVYNQIDSNFVKGELDRIKEQIDLYYHTNFDKHKNDISRALEYEIKRRFLSHSSMISEFIHEDNTINAAAQLLSSGKYDRILAHKKNKEDDEN